MNILLTGAGGFVGSHILSHLLKTTEHDITCLCSWKHKGSPTRIIDSDEFPDNADRITVITHDLVSPVPDDVLRRIGVVDVILNIGSESHVDRSITDPVSFITNNTNLAMHMLELARLMQPALFLQFSTDEVYGQANDGENHVEWSPIIPSNPYAASKAAQEAIAISYWRTYRVPLVITNTMNVFSSRQDWEKFIPMCVDRILAGLKIQIHGYPDGKRAGSRFYISANNVASAVTHIMNKHIRHVPMYPEVNRPERYNIVGEQEVDNLTLAKMIADILGKPLDYEIVDFHSARPGHDCRYALDGRKLKEDGWQHDLGFNLSLTQTVRELAQRHVEEQR